MASNNLNDGHSVIAVAHLDDEILWFEPFIQNAMAIVVVGQPLSNSRWAGGQQIFGPGNTIWGRTIPVISIGDTMTDQAWFDEASQPWARDAKYNEQWLIQKLRPVLAQLKAQGMTRVITHNPWGEYGHYNHRACSAVVRNMGAYDLGFDVWHSAVVHTNTNKPLPVGQYLEATGLSYVEYTPAHTFNIQRFQQARAIYQSIISNANPAQDLWTWHDGANEWPTGPRKYWCCVKNGVNMLAQHPVLLAEVQNIRRDPGHVWAPEDPRHSLLCEPYEYN